MPLDLCWLCTSRCQREREIEIESPEACLLWIHGQGDGDMVTKVDEVVLGRIQNNRERTQLFEIRSCVLKHVELVKQAPTPRAIPPFLLLVSSSSFTTATATTCSAECCASHASPS
jgi:hypothetical protein